MLNTQTNLNKVKRASASLQALLPNDKYILKIIKMCNLHPVNGAWRCWTDHLGNGLMIVKKKILIVKDKEKIIISDLYYKSYPCQIAKASSKAIIAFGEGNVCFIWFLGNDNKLRLCVYKNKWLENYPLLSCPIKTLKLIIKKLSLVEPQKIDAIQDIEGPIDCKIIKCWTSNIILDENIKKDMMETNTVMAAKIISIFNGEQK